MKSEKISFEDILKRLEDIVEKMETGGISLEESMKLYEEGMQKITLLTSMLSEAREKVMKLVSDGESSSRLEVFEEEDTE
jgi:exodeoxyribonuclease VII small subunit